MAERAGRVGEVAPAALEPEDEQDGVKVAGGLHVPLDTVLDAKDALAGLLRILQIHKPDFADREVQDIDARELKPGPVLLLRARCRLQDEDVRAALVAFYHVHLRQVEAQEGDVPLAMQQGEPVVFEVHLREVEKGRAAEFGVVVDPDVLGGHFR